MGAGVLEFRGEGGGGSEKNTLNPKPWGLVFGFCRGGAAELRASKVWSGLRVEGVWG